MNYTKSFPLYPAITNPQSEKAPIAEFTNPAAYRLAPQGESHRFFIPATIYGYLLKKTQSLITRLGKMEDTINELKQAKQASERRDAKVIDSLSATITRSHNTRGYLNSKINERDQRIETLTSELKFKTEVLEQVERKLGEASAKLPSELQSTVDALRGGARADAKRIYDLELALFNIRGVLGGFGWNRPQSGFGPPPVALPAGTPAPSPSSPFAPKADPFRGILDGIDGTIRGQITSVGKAYPVNNTPCLTITGGLVTEIKPPVEGYARSISNGIKSGDASRFNTLGRIR